MPSIEDDMSIPLVILQDNQPQTMACTTSPTVQHSFQILFILENVRLTYSHAEATPLGNNLWSW
jgi:hypothetical protein